MLPVVVTCRSRSSRSGGYDGSLIDLFFGFFSGSSKGKQPPIGKPTQWLLCVCTGKYKWLYPILRGSIAYRCAKGSYPERDPATTMRHIIYRQIFTVNIINRELSLSRDSYLKIQYENLQTYET